MTEKKVNETKKREPDCVTEVRFGKSVLVVKGYFKENGTKTKRDGNVGAISLCHRRQGYICAVDNR